MNHSNGDNKNSDMIDTQKKETKVDAETDKVEASASTTTANKNSSDVTYETTSLALIEKLLQFSTPKLDSKIVNVLFLEGMMDIFMTHLTRLSPTKTPVQLSKCSLEDKLDYASHERDTSDLEAMKRSYHAMEFLSGTTANHLWLQNSKFYTIVNHLFEMFLPQSSGNFNHFFKIFQHLVRRHPCDMLEFIVLRDNASILFDYMMPYLTESAIIDSILSLMFVRDINAETKVQREKCHKRLQELGFLEWVLNAIQLKDRPKVAEAAQEFLLRAIEEASQVDNTDVLFESIKSDKGETIIETLVRLIIERPRSLERERIVTIVKLFVKSGMLATRASSMSQFVQGPLYNISMQSQELLIKHIPALCHLLITDHPSATTKSCPLTASDMDLLDIFYQTLYNANDKTQMLASTPNTFWKLLVNSFFEKSSSNIYHTLFYRIICLTLSINHEPTFIVLIRKQSLITRLIDTYESNQPTDTRGFILLILNQLRLMAEAHHSDLITRIILGHPRYLTFLPTLRKHTLAQIEPIYTWKLEACPRPPAHLGPSPPIQCIHFSPYAGSIPLMSNIADTDETAGIDLGSDYAFCLGFKETAKEIDPPYEYLSRRNSGHSDYSYSSQPVNDGFPMDIIWGESLTADDEVVPTPSTSKSKKKKKKKKKSNALVLN
ncbi:hypothetical protein BDB01DRAFT_790752 [Pilobolus umbonatus]|nr:hypothetical protein BDB01DRAFT_790752 [Pilobolus umbonatus]